MSDPELTPEQTEEVRRLLAEARHDAPIPAEIAARLDDVLAGLRPDSVAPPTAPVVDLAARRRRRNASFLLGAAAAVIVGGFGIGRVIDVGGDDAGSGGGSAADSSVDRESTTAGSSQDSGESAGDPADDSADSGSDASAPETQLRAGEPLELSSESLARDVEAQLPTTVADQPAPEGGAAADALPQDVNSCATAGPTAYGSGQFFAAFYDGVPALLVLRPAEGDSRRADVLACDTAERLDSVELPAP